MKGVYVITLSKHGGVDVMNIVQEGGYLNVP